MRLRPRGRDVEMAAHLLLNALNGPGAYPAFAGDFENALVGP